MTHFPKCDPFFSVQPSFFKSDAFLQVWSILSSVTYIKNGDPDSERDSLFSVWLFSSVTYFSKCDFFKIFEIVPHV